MKSKPIAKLGCLVFLTVTFIPRIGWAQESAADEPVTTEHSIRVHGKTLSYSAHVGYLSLRDEWMKVHGRMFYVAYTVSQPPMVAPRPLVFVWNGGPGSNAALLELGALGPRRVKHGEETANGHAHELTDNEDTWLQFADLVFVDPIYTGYSYATTPQYEKEFLSDQGDADAMAEFIRLYRAHYQSQQAPLYLMGESYGTYRAVGVADVLIKRKIPVQGMILLSNVYSFTTNADLSSAFLLPNYTAAAFAQQKLSLDQQADLKKALAESQAWAESSYLTALVRGDRLGADEKHAVAEKLAHFTGIASDTWEKSNLRLGPDQFAIDVLDPAKLNYVGHYDTRLVGKMSHPGAPYDVDADPSLDNGVDALIVPYLHTELGWKSDALYAGPFGGRWPSPSSPRGDWTSMRWDRSGGSPDRGPVFAAVVKGSPAMRVLIASGEFDLSTPFASVEYSVSHLQLGTEARKRVEFVRYEGGHAAYMDPTARQQLFNDAQKLVMAH